jgi:hypothetical protein
VAKQRLNEEIRKILSIEEEIKAEDEIARRKSEIAEKNAKTTSAMSSAHSSREKGQFASDVVEPMRSVDSNIVDDFPQDPIMRGIEEINKERDNNADDVPVDVEFQLVDNGETTVARQGRMNALVKGIDLMAFFQSFHYRAISFLFGPMICLWIIA